MFLCHLSSCLIHIAPAEPYTRTSPVPFVITVAPVIAILTLLILLTFDMGVHVTLGEIACSLHELVLCRGMEEVIHPLPQRFIAMEPILFKLVVRLECCNEDRVRIAFPIFHGDRDESSVRNVAYPGPARVLEVHPAAIFILLGHD